jgi:hypothetical protein
MNFWRIPIKSRRSRVMRMDVPFQKGQRPFTLPMQTPASPADKRTVEAKSPVRRRKFPMPTDKVGQSLIDKIERWSMTLRAGFRPSDQRPDRVRRCSSSGGKSVRGAVHRDEVDHFQLSRWPPLPSLPPRTRVSLSMTSAATGPPPARRAEPHEKRFSSASPPRRRTGPRRGLGDAPNGIGISGQRRDSYAFDHRTFVVDIPQHAGGTSFRPSRLPVSPGLIIRPRCASHRDREHHERSNLPGLGVVKDPVRNALTLKLPDPGCDGVARARRGRPSPRDRTPSLVGDEYALKAPPWCPRVLVLAGSVEPDVAPATSSGGRHYRRCRQDQMELASDCRSEPDHGAINPWAGKSTVPVAPKGFRFKSAQPMSVFLRQRARLKAFPTDRKTSEECKVVSVSADGSVVKISRAAGTLGLHDTFPAGSILYAPVPAPVILQPPRPFLTIVSPLAERLMAKSGTLSGKSCNLTDETIMAPRSNHRASPPEATTSA